jgi:hypothetical protein
VEVSLGVLSVSTTVSIVDVVLLVVSVVTSAFVSLISDVTSFSFCWLLTWSMLSAVASMASCISLVALELG